MELVSPPGVGVVRSVMAIYPEVLALVVNKAAGIKTLQDIRGKRINIGNPGSGNEAIIKDDAIPDLLRQQKQPTFVTINDIDFWRKVAIDNQFCVVCFAFSDSRVREISGLLKWLLQQSEFKTKAKRMGKVIRVTGRLVSYYTVAERTIKTITLPGSAWSRPNVGLLLGRK